MEEGGWVGKKASEWAALVKMIMGAVIWPAVLPAGHVSVCAEVNGRHQDSLPTYGDRTVRETPP